MVSASFDQIMALLYVLRSSKSGLFMAVEKLKRIKVSSVQELQVWLAKNATLSQDVMIVTCSKISTTKHISSAQVRAALGKTGWVSGPSQTLGGNLLGHIIRRA